MAAKSTGSNPDTRTKTLLLFGKTGSGKSATGNTILGEKKFKVSSKGQTTRTYQVETCQRGDLTLKIIDTPDITEKMPDDPSFDPLREVARWIVEAEDGFDALLFVHHFGVRFSDQQKDVFKALEDTFGKEIFRHMIVVLSYGDEFERARDEEGITLEGYMSDKWNGLSGLLERVDRRLVLFDNRTKDEEKRASQVDGLMNRLRDVMDAHGGQPYRSKYLPPRSPAHVPAIRQSSAGREPPTNVPYPQDAAALGIVPSDAQEAKVQSVYDAMVEARSRNICPGLCSVL